MLGQLAELWSQIGDWGIVIGASITVAAMVLAGWIDLRVRVSRIEGLRENQRDHEERIRKIEANPKWQR